MQVFSSLLIALNTLHPEPFTFFYSLPGSTAPSPIPNRK
jgi:hypothetical protein